MNRIDLFRTKKVLSTPFRTTPFSTTPATLDSVTWGKTNFDKTFSTLAFAALLIVCSVAVGCSGDKPITTNSTSLR